jgi:xanthine dehydrogenase large subunit
MIGRSPLHRDARHESGLRHATGEARYVDDLPRPPGSLVARVVTALMPRGRLVRVDVDAARAVPGVRAVLTVDDVPGHADIGAIFHDEPVLARGEVHYHGQPVVLVVADDADAARRGAEAVVVKIEPLKALLSIEEAEVARSWLPAGHTIARGDVEAALRGAAEVVEAELRCGAQEHFYLETQAALAIPGEGGTIEVHTSTQHPTEVQRDVARVLGWGANRVVATATRLGGGFGGKESQASPVACLAALAAVHTGRPVALRYDRHTDMSVTGRRHPFRLRYRAGFDADGRLVALDAELVADGGWSADLTSAIVDRAMFHADNCQFVPHVRLVGKAVRTNLPSNTAFRGFGGPQGMLVMYDALHRYAERHGLDPVEVHRRSFYRDGDETPYRQPVDDARVGRIVDELVASSDYAARRAAIEAFNATSRWVKRGIALQPVKFGISFTNTMLNQAGALVLVYTDGTVQLSHGGVEMGQGLHTKMIAVAADTLGVQAESVRVMPTSTEKVPNTSATAASSGADLNGQAVFDACQTLRERMRPVAAAMLSVPEADVRFIGGLVGTPAGQIPFAEVAQRCWLERVSLSATGFYRTPGIHYDKAAGAGRPFLYFAWGAAVAEVELSVLTGEHRLLRADVLHDCGRSLVPGIDRGQVEGAFIQGMGWLTMEETRFGPDGRGLTVGPSTYKIPAVGDTPADLRVALLERADQPGTIGKSKAVGEPPFMLGIAVPAALRHALLGVAPGEVELALPATGEALLLEVGRRLAGGGGGG